MKTQTIRVQLCDMDKLANILCEMDFELAVDNPKAAVKILIENAHETLSDMLGRHASEI